MSNIQQDDGSGKAPKCQCKPECNAPVYRNRWGWTKYAKGHKPHVEKTLIPRKPKEHTDDSRPTLPIREVSRDEFDRMAKASDSTYKPEPEKQEKPIQTTSFPTSVQLAKEAKALKFPKAYPEVETVGLDNAQYVPSSAGHVEAAPSRSGLFLVATSLAAFLAGLIIGKKRR